MSLIDCPECDNEVSSEAQSCPKCGYVLKKERKSGSGCGSGCGCLAIIVILGIIGLFTDIYDNDSKPRTPEELRRDRIEKHFSAWDGSHIGLTKVIKQTMNDPGSYEHVKTTYSDPEDGQFFVKTTFRGKNAFGGVVTNWVTARVDMNGNVLEIVSQGP